MRCLLLVAHGSRRAESNQEICNLVVQLTPLLAEQYAQVNACFLELAQPDIAQAVDDAVAAGCDDVVLLPYFLAAGRHVVSDVPAIVEQARQRHPSVKITTTAYLGEHQALPDLLASIARASV